jgi:hypothetical protein
VIPAPPGTTASWALPLARGDEYRQRGHAGRVWINGPTFRGVCSCAWLGEPRATRSEADRDATLHAAGFLHYQERLTLA